MAASAKTKQRYIYCLEGNWNKHPHSNQSIKPILDLLLTFSKTKYIYRKCPTKEDQRGLYKRLASVHAKTILKLHRFIYSVSRTQEPHLFRQRVYHTKRDCRCVGGQIKRQNRTLRKLFDTQHNGKEHHGLY